MPKIKVERILFTGSSGLLGSFLQQIFSQETSASVLTPSHLDLDITNLEAVKRYFAIHGPTVVINLAAHRNATTAEKQRGDKLGSVWKTNVEGARNLAWLCHDSGAFLIHISTDYVFSGVAINPGPYTEEEKPEVNDALLSWYGITKREAEREVQSILTRPAIIRINNVTRPNNTLELDYIGKILWLYRQQKLYPLFNDQIITLTYIPFLTEIFKRLMLKPQAGIFHAASTNSCTPFELARYSLDLLDQNQEVVRGVSIDSFLEKNPGRYPKLGGLKTEITQKKLGLEFIDWQEMVALFIKKETSLF